MKINVGGWKGFTAEDFYGLELHQAENLADRANAILAEKLAGAPEVGKLETMVHPPGFPDSRIHATIWSHNLDVKEFSHTARLVNIEEVKK